MKKLFLDFKMTKQFIDAKMSERSKAIKLMQESSKYAYHNVLSFREESYLTNIRKITYMVIDNIITELEGIEFNYDLEFHFKETCLSKTTIPYWKRIKEEVAKLTLEDLK